MLGKSDNPHHSTGEINGQGHRWTTKNEGGDSGREQGVAIPAQVRWQLNPQIIRAREPRGEIKASLVVFIVWGKTVTQRDVNNGIIAAGVQNKRKQYTNVCPDCLWELCCGWRHIESKCSHHQPKCG
jgi:hypothetical protein